MYQNIYERQISNRRKNKVYNTVPTIVECCFSHQLHKQFISVPRSAQPTHQPTVRGSARRPRSSAEDERRETHVHGVGPRSAQLFPAEERVRRRGHVLSGNGKRRWRCDAGRHAVTCQTGEIAWTTNGDRRRYQ